MRLDSRNPRFPSVRPAVRPAINGLGIALPVMLWLGMGLMAPGSANSAPPNILIVTVDDMNADSLGCFGCRLPDTSPNIDDFAKTALRFQHAHVQVGNCMPGRNIMWSGLFAHANGVEGFRQNRDAKHPHLCDLAKQAGYFTAIRGKTSHSTPYTPYAWDAVLDQDPTGAIYPIKDADSYGTSTARAFNMAHDAGKPLCLIVNISDPHKPFYSGAKDRFQPTRVFGADEVPVPGFLPDDPVVKKELALYYSSVRRADDAFAKIIAALNASGQADNTFVMFLSDHGMPLPFAKTQLYHHSTHTPLMVRWPGVTKPDSIDRQHMVSAIDFVPTLLDVMQHSRSQSLASDFHGRSFAPLLRGDSQDHRDFVVLQYNENAGGNRHPMRGIETRQMLYLFNPWSDGKRKFASATTGTATYRRMKELAADDSAIAARMDLLDHRVVEELYDVQNDPDCLRNLIKDPQYQEIAEQLRSQLTKSLEQCDDPLAPVLARHQDASVRMAYMETQDAMTESFRKGKRNGNRKKPIAKKENAKRENAKK